MHVYGYLADYVTLKSLQYERFLQAEAKLKIAAGVSFCHYIYAHLAEQVGDNLIPEVLKLLKRRTQ